MAHDDELQDEKEWEKLVDVIVQLGSAGDVHLWEKSWKIFSLTKKSMANEFDKRSLLCGMVKVAFNSACSIWQFDKQSRLFNRRFDNEIQSYLW